MLLLLPACGGTAGEPGPGDAASDAVADVSADAGATDAADATPEAGPVLCVVAGAGFECSADGGAFETSGDGGWVSCLQAPCQPGLECRAGTVTGVCVQR